jgi:hypothetical protein
VLNELSNGGKRMYEVKLTNGALWSGLISNYESPTYAELVMVVGNVLEMTDNEAGLLVMNIWRNGGGILAKGLDRETSGKLAIEVRKLFDDRCQRDIVTVCCKASSAVKGEL